MSKPSMEMKVVARQLGGHMHCNVFTRTPPTETWANCGTLVFSEGEWMDARVTFECGGAEVEEIL